jgi:hypothetical protein
MKMSRAVTLVCVALITGIVTGASVAVWWQQKEMNQVRADAAAAAILIETAALVRLKANDLSEAQSVLETNLDSNLVILHGFPAARAQEAVQRVLRRTAEYRAKYPHASQYPEIDAGVSNVLSEAADKHK